MNCEHIYHATNERLTEMLEEHNRWRRGEKPYDIPCCESPHTPTELGVMIAEAARRLRGKTEGGEQ